MRGSSCGTQVFRPVALPFAPLDQLLDTKSTDRKMTLLHFIALTVKEKYPDLANFWHELHFVEKAAAGESPARRAHPCVQPRTIPRSYEEKNAWVPFWLFFLILRSFPLGLWAGATPERAFLQAPRPTRVLWELVEKGSRGSSTPQAGPGACVSL